MSSSYLPHRLHEGPGALRSEHDPASETKPSDAEEIGPGVSGHEGSASPSLTGRGVLLAWILSIGLHIGGLGATLLVVFPFVGTQKEAPPSALARVVGDVDAVAPPPSQITELPQQSAAPDALDRLFRPDATRAAEAIEQLSGTSVQKQPELSIVGIVAGGGDIARGGLTLGGGAGPEFFGLGATAPGVRTIVFVVDRSGSMVGTFAAVRAELKRSISALRRSQKFHVIFFNSSDPVENPPMRPVNAVDANKREFFEFLQNVTPGGGTRPERAMRRALALEPDLIYFLSDGLFEAELLDRLDEWNRTRRTKIYTIAYLDQSGRKLLESIARQHGGEFKFVTDDELP